MKRRGFVSNIASLATIATAVQAQSRVQVTLETNLADYTQTAASFTSFTSILPEPSQVPVREQVLRDSNKIVAFRTCADITCTDQSDFFSAGVCYETDRYSLGVGIFPNAVNVSDTDLSLTLINGASEAARWESDWQNGGYREEWNYAGLNPENVRHELFVGAPANFNLREADPGCALMLLDGGQPFAFRAYTQSYPEAPPSPNVLFEPQQNSNINRTEFTDEADAIVSNTSWCPSGPYSWIANYTREFRYGANSSFSRCGALAAYVNERIREEELVFGHRSRPFNQQTPIQVIGGAISGPDAPGEPRGLESQYNGETLQIGSEDCRPVLPESYSFYNVSFANMPLYLYQDDRSTPDVDESGPISIPSLGGRNGTTVVYTAVYGNEEDSDPDVRYLCMEMRDSLGRELPGQTFFSYEGSSDRTLRRPIALFAVAAAIITALALQF